MLKILTGLVSGIVSGTGMGRRNNTNTNIISVYAE